MTEPSARPSGALASCPLLGLPDDPQTHYLYTNGAHRCRSRPRPMAIDADHQARFCLTNGYTACNRYERWVRGGVEVPRVAAQTSQVLELAAKTSPVGEWATGPQSGRRNLPLLLLIAAALVIALLAVGAATLRPREPARRAAVPGFSASMPAYSPPPSRVDITPLPSTGSGQPAASAPQSTEPSSPPAARTAPPRRVHVVQAGDWLSTIAARYGTTVEELLRLNEIVDRDVIEVGQEIVLPPTSPP